MVRAVSLGNIARPAARGAQGRQHRFFKSVDTFLDVRIQRRQLFGIEPTRTPQLRDVQRHLVVGLRMQAPLEALHAARAAARADVPQRHVSVLARLTGEEEAFAVGVGRLTAN